MEVAVVGAGAPDCAKSPSGRVSRPRRAVPAAPRASRARIDARRAPSPPARLRSPLAQFLEPDLRQIRQHADDQAHWSL